MSTKAGIQKMLTWIDNASYEDLLRRWRNEPIGSPWFQEEIGDHFEEVLLRKRDEDPEAHVAASKAIGWREEEVSNVRDK